jgi:uncharacterized protein YceK
MRTILLLAAVCVIVAGCASPNESTKTNATQDTGNDTVGNSTGNTTNSTMDGNSTLSGNSSNSTGTYTAPP